MRLSAGLFRFAPHALRIGAFTVALTSCAPPRLPSVRGVAATSSSPGTAWTPPPASPFTTPSANGTGLPPDLAAAERPLSIAELVALALERNPETRASWASARAQAARLGEARGDLFPRIVGDIGVTFNGATSSGTRPAFSQQSFGPSVSLNWLLYDMGGRSGSIGAAEAALLSADWSHNALLADLARRTAQAYFDFAGTQSLLEAARLTWEQARTNLAAAEDRRAVGVATVADVLQARTAVAQALLALQDVQGAVATTRGSLATLAGLRPSTVFAVDSAVVFAPIGALADSVDTFIARALAQRPDLAAARALAEQRHQEARVVAAQRRPSLALGSSAGQDWTSGNASQASYQLGIGVSIPIFNGFGWEFAAQAATLAAEAQDARTRVQEQQVGLQVFVTYQVLRTATQRVRAADDLFASASQSADAARARYRGEVGTLIELLNAEGALADARAQRIQARVQWQTALIQLAHDSGLLGINGSAPLRLTPLPADSIR